MQHVTVTDHSGNALFDIEIAYLSLKCHWTTKKLYFTFPVVSHQISDISCPQNQYCGWGDHCKIGKSFLRLTTESLHCTVG